MLSEAKHLYQYQLFASSLPEIPPDPRSGGLRFAPAQNDILWICLIALRLHRSAASATTPSASRSLSVQNLFTFLLYPFDKLIRLPIIRLLMIRLQIV
jgi:hypothetical protein